MPCDPSLSGMDRLGGCRADISFNGVLWASFCSVSDPAPPRVEKEREYSGGPVEYGFALAPLNLDPRKAERCGVLPSRGWRPVGVGVDSGFVDFRPGTRRTGRCNQR